MSSSLKNLREKAAQLPAKPGIYQMLDGAGKVLYIGKAKQLKNRVSSYFTGRLDDKTTALVAKINDFAVIVCGSEYDALLLECAQIKALQPRYNILLKDGKGYSYIRLERDRAYPRFTIVSKKREGDAAIYFGPYMGRSISKSAINAVSRALQLPTCTRVLPRDIGRERPCLNAHMNHCRAWCTLEQTRAEYDDAMRQAVLILRGKHGAAIEDLRQSMEQAAAETRFEAAAQFRDQIRALEKLTKRQNVVASALSDMDVAGFYRGATASCFAVLHYIGGQLMDKDYALLDDPLEDTPEAVSALVKQYYLSREFLPKTIYLPCNLDDLEPLETALTQQAGHRVRLHVPQRGQGRALLEVAAENAKVEAERIAGREERVRGILQWLEKTLGLPAPPMRIEAFDISNFGNSGIVAAMTVFQNARPLKKEYRKFKIKTLDGQDDYHSMEEVITRRFQRHQEGVNAFAALPDLLLIDGGAAHASVAAKVVADLGLRVPVFGMVKDNKHKTRALISPAGAEIGIVAVPQVFAFIGTIQEETHRFAITYQRSLRSKQYSSALDEIPGIGKARRAALLKHFKSVKQIAAASKEELAQVVPLKLATAIAEHFKAGKSE